MRPPSSDIAFTPTVKEIQQRRGSRRAYARMEASGGWQTRATPELASFLAEQDSVVFATANAHGQPYAQHRGGPKGFVRVLDERTLAFAEYKGNRQYITFGNLADNPKAFLIAIDYAGRARVKIWGRATVVENDEALFARLRIEDAPARIEQAIEQAIVFEIEAWDANCPSHIPRKISEADVRSLVASLQLRIEALEAENATLRASREGSRGSRGSAEAAF